MLRGWLTLIFTSLAILVGDVIQRVVVAPSVRLRPSARIPILGGWIKIMAWLVTRPVDVIGGCRIPRPLGVVPTQPGVLILMNHQSLFDIPLVIQTVLDGYPRIVTRKRYARWIPLISKMIRLYQYPVVDPSANASVVRRALDGVQSAAASSDVPIVVFPEGTRTKDGEIGRFKLGALSRILSVRSWTVYVFVGDGFWRAAKLKHFAREVGRIEGKMEHVATLAWEDPRSDPAPFLEHVRGLMVERLRAMRAGGDGA
ncbi:MAG TPA: lysophospholipid acyltransferase family protein [Longimicrobiales bacterium]|nr:lysophospholipid acyltransferase family protein [Longimicrobiales bacterium]